MFLTVPQRPAIRRAVGFGPPAIQFRAVQSTIHQDLHTAGTAGLPGTTGGIDPDIHPLDELGGYQHVVVCQKNHFVEEIRMLP